jgi:hypothetical protein
VELEKPGQQQPALSNNSKAVVEKVQKNLGKADRHRRERERERERKKERKRESRHQNECMHSVYLLTVLSSFSGFEKET